MDVIAYEVARQLGVPALYAKKAAPTTMANFLRRTIRSPTKGVTMDLCISQEYLSPKDQVLIVDDFLYQGWTSAALAEMVCEANATPVGLAFIIGKRFGKGRDVLARFGVPIVSLVVIERLDPRTGQIVWAES